MMMIVQEDYEKKHNQTIEILSKELLNKIKRTEQLREETEQINEQMELLLKKEQEKKNKEEKQAIQEAKRARDDQKKVDKLVCKEIEKDADIARMFIRATKEDPTLLDDSGRLGSWVDEFRKKGVNADMTKLRTYHRLVTTVE